MQDKYKINISKLAVSLIALSLAMSGIVVFNFGINVRMLHLLIPILLALLFVVKFRWMKGLNLFLFNKTSILFIIFLLITFYTTLVVSIEKGSDLRLWIATLANAFIGVIFYGVLSDQKVNNLFFLRLSYYSIVLVCFVITVQLVLSALKLYEPHMYGENGFFLLGRPSAFFGDPGWLAYWLIIFSLFVFENKRVNNIKTLDFNRFILVLLAGLLISQSRISIVFILINFYLLVLHKKTVRRFILLSIIFSAVITILILIYIGIIEIPENLYYDLVNIEANPRYYDTITIYNEYINSANIWFGNGLGSLDRLVEIYPWRNYTNSHNVFFLQILNDSGIVGVLIMLIIIIGLYKKLNTRIARIMFVEFIILLNFHNIFPYFQLFWFLLAFIFVLDKKYGKASFIA